MNGEKSTVVCVCVCENLKTIILSRVESPRRYARLFLFCCKLFNFCLFHDIALSYHDFYTRHTTTIDRFDSARPSCAAETVRDCCTEQPAAAAVRPCDPCACASPSRHSAAPLDSVFRFRKPCASSSSSESESSSSVRASRRADQRPTTQRVTDGETDRSRRPTIKTIIVVGARIRLRRPRPR